MHILEEWRFRDVEQKADRAANRLHELDSLRSDVASLERSNGELRSEVARLCDELIAALERVGRLEDSALAVIPTRS